MCRKHKERSEDTPLLFDDWKKSTSFDKYSLLIDSEHHRFLNTYDFNMHTMFNSKKKGVYSLYQELDLKNAYFNYSNTEYNPHYCGVPRKDVEG
jgi:hypothetical protein